MSKAARRWVVWAIVGVVFGALLGVAVGWWWWPVEYTNTAPSVLRQDYHDDYIVMVAAAYQIDEDVEHARERLGLLDPEEPAGPVVDLAERLVEGGGDTETITRLARLAGALGVTTSTLVPYLESAP